MHTFLHSWRRKAGVVILVVALATYGAWMRSCAIHDAVTLPWGNGIIWIESMWGQVDFARVELYDNEPIASWTSNEITRATWPHLDDHGNPQAADHLKEVDEIEWRWDWAGFRFGAGHSWDRRSEDYILPYWSLALPLTILSAYLILWKPRKRASPNSLVSTRSQSDRNGVRT